MELERGDIVEIEKGIYLKNDVFGYSIKYPVKKDEDMGLVKGNIDWRNLLLGGSWFNFSKTLVVIFIILFALWSYNNDISECTEFLDTYTIIDTGTNLICYKNIIDFEQSNEYDLLIPSQSIT